MVDPHASGVLDSDTIVVEHTGDLQVTDDNVGSADDGDTVGANSSARGSSPDRLVGSDTETCWEVESTLNDDIVGSITLVQISMAESSCHRGSW